MTKDTENFSYDLSRPILIYDNECALCKRFKVALDFLDGEGKILKVPLQDEALYRDFPFLSRVECEEKIHLLTTNGHVYRGSEVIEFLVGFYPKVKTFAWLVESESGKKAANFFYDKVNELRKKMKSNCAGCAKKR